MTGKNGRILQSDNVTKKTWNYSLDGVNINFTLRNDVKIELKAAVEILQKAIKDFEAEIEQIGK